MSIIDELIVLMGFEAAPGSAETLSKTEKGMEKVSGKASVLGVTAGKLAALVQSFSKISESAELAERVDRLEKMIEEKGKTAC